MNVEQYRGAFIAGRDDTVYVVSVDRADDGSVDAMMAIGPFSSRDEARGFVDLVMADEG